MTTRTSPKQTNGCSSPTGRLKDKVNTTNQNKGHLIIHNVSLKEAKEIMKYITTKIEADWWTQDNIARLDSAASFAMLTHGFTKTDTPIRLKGKKVEELLKEETDKCCRCGAEATVASEGSLYCHRCAMDYAK